MPRSINLTALTTRIPAEIQPSVASHLGRSPSPMTTATRIAASARQEREPKTYPVSIYEDPYSSFRGGVWKIALMERYTQAETTDLELEQLTILTPPARALP
jgi:hypothetical protein